MKAVRKSNFNFSLVGKKCRFCTLGSSGRWHFVRYQGLFIVMALHSYRRGLKVGTFFLLVAAEPFLIVWWRFQAEACELQVAHDVMMRSNNTV